MWRRWSTVFSSFSVHLPFCKSQLPTWFPQFQLWGCLKSSYHKSASMVIVWSILCPSSELSEPVCINFSLQLVGPSEFSWGVPLLFSHVLLNWSRTNCFPLLWGTASRTFLVIIFEGNRFDMPPKIAWFNVSLYITYFVVRSFDTILGSLYWRGWVHCSSWGFSVLFLTHILVTLICKN